MRRYFHGTIGFSSLVTVFLSGGADVGAWAAPPHLARPQDQARFDITTFASGLSFPTSMTELGDGSLLVATSAGGPNSSLWQSGTGTLLRLVDDDGDGAADGTPQVLATGLPGLVTSVRRVGSLVAALSSQTGSQAITFLRTGSTTTQPFVTAGSLQFSFPTDFEHTTYTLAARPRSGGVDVYFNVGAKANSVSTSSTATVGLSSVNVAFASTSLVADSIYRVTVTDGSGGLAAAVPERIASGLRNAAGMVFDTNGNLWLQDNGIDDPADRSRSLSADELNRIAAADLGNSVPDFGFATCYVDYATGAIVGPTTGVTLPLAAFTPIGTEKSEGAVELALAPASFPQEFAGGVFVPFSGGGNSVAANDENPVVFCDPTTGSYFHFIENQLMGHPNGLLATADALYLSDLSTTGALFGTVDGVPADAAGAIYRIVPVPEPAAWSMAVVAILVGTLARVRAWCAAAGEAARTLRRRATGPTGVDRPMDSVYNSSRLCRPGARRAVIHASSDVRPAAIRLHRLRHLHG